MTRRIRFSPFLATGVFSAAIAVGAVQAHASDVPFVAEPPVPGSLSVTDAFVADVDGDGDTDLVSASVLTDTVAWHENAVGNGTVWITHTISTADNGPNTVVAADVDGDGDQDVVSGSFFDDKVAWYENAAGNGTVWIQRTISPSADGTNGVFAGDVDGDGDVDVLSASRYDDKIAWYENTAGNGTAWTPRTITTLADGAFSVFAADVDGDGDLDALSASLYDDRVIWYENATGNGTVWIVHTVSTAADRTGSVFAGDVDRDGDLDVLSASRYDDKIAWYENTAGNGTAWTTHVVSTSADGAFTVFAADVDHDGDLDVLSASYIDGRVAWYENTSGDGTSWTPRTIFTVSEAIDVLAADVDGDGDLDVLSADIELYGNSLRWYRNDTIHESACFAPAAAVSTASNGAASVAAGDLDGDGDLDALAALRIANRVEWHENAAGDGSAWTPRTIATATTYVSGALVADVDGDGDLDAMSVGYYSGLRWHRNDNGTGTAWTGIPIGATGFTPVAADVDGDGDLDAVLSLNLFDPLLKWYENTAGNGSAWTLHTIAMATSGGAGYALAAADLDGDGDVDVVANTDIVGVTPLLWFENSAGNGSAWTTRTVATTPTEARALAPVDVDGDGDLDVVAAGIGGTVWHENTNGAATAWALHTVGAGSFLSVAARDLDADGDVDVVAGRSSAGVSWFENSAGNGSAWSVHDPPGGASGSGDGVAVADVDRNGEPDLLWASVSANRVNWFQHQGGQFSLAGTDISPGAAANGDLVPLVRLVVTHLGRAGDGDLELASLGLLFEETAGDPLTSAEANALVENLHVYRDANGNGSFDPGTDVLVASVATLSLVNGVQTVTFADGDPGVQVALGTPRTYFVVTELTGNASGQTPNEFQVTHLGTGPAASTAEDRAHDIPLRPACPANVTAAVGPITPVELQAFTVE